ncbi:hypothetical protein [Streptomyces sp. NPDC048636]|uniref:hypothetical protein n=1 Tax=Streptomyces sp. NPDC048636 TaxID=3155762 RepID=UPI00341E7422
MSEPQPYRPPPGEPLPGWPALDSYGPAQQPLSGAVELAAERGPVVYIPGAHGGFVAVRRDDLPTVHAPAPLPAPVGMDPVAQRMAAAGLGGGALSAGVGWGISEAASGIAGISGGGLMWLAILLLASRLAPSARRVREGDTFITHHHVTNRWWGRSHTSIRNR